MIVINNRSRKVCSGSQNRSLKAFTLVIFLRIKCRMEFNPQRQLHSNITQNTLKAYVVGPLTSKHQVCAVRSFYVDGVLKEKIWITKRLLESLLEENPYVVYFFSCITPLSEGKHGKENRQSNKDSSNGYYHCVSFSKQFK